MLAGLRTALPADVRLVRVGVEAAGHYHQPMIAPGVWPQGWRVLELNPAHVSAHRRVNGSRAVKTDRVDLTMIADLLLAGRGVPVVFGEEPLVELQAWVAHRRRRVEVRTATKNQLLGQLDRAFPGHDMTMNTGSRHQRCSSGQKAYAGQGIVGATGQCGRRPAEGTRATSRTGRRSTCVVSRSVTEILAAVFGAFLGVLGALYAAFRTARRAEQVASTSAAISEFFSDGFLKHRVSLHKTRQKCRMGEVLLRDVAAGFWYPGQGGNYFEGDTDGDFNEHQHIEAYLGFVSRVDYLLRRGWAEPSDLERALSAKLIWTDDFLRKLAAETVRQAREAGAPRPQWVDSFENVSRLVISDLARDPS